MALVKAKLKEEILKMINPDHASFVGYPADVATAAANWKTAYDTYALDAADVSGDSVSLVNAALFESTLIAQLPPGDPGGTAAAAAAAYDLAFVQYWTGGVFAIGIPPPSGIGGNGIFGVELSSVVSVVAPSVLQGLLVAVFGNATMDIDAKASELADAFHTATTTAITVLITGLDTTPPPAGPLPITNTDLVY